MKQLLHNKIRCKRCGDVIESKFTHDFQTCSCGAVSVDGGRAYASRSFTGGLDTFEDLSEWSDDDAKGEENDTSLK